MHTPHAHSHKLRSHRQSLRAHWYMITTLTAVRRPIFAENTSAQVVADALNHYHHRGVVHGFAWVIMPDHIHWVLQLRVGSLPWLLRAFKTWTSRMVRRCHSDPPPSVWMRGYHDRLIRENEEVSRYIEYVVLNPVRAGLVDHPMQYPWVYGESEWLNVRGKEPAPIAGEVVDRTRALPWQHSRPEGRSHK